MSDSGDDLHGRQLVLLLLFFGTVGGGMYFLGWLTRPSWLYDNPIACAAIAGAACYPARFLVERFEWWTRLEQPTQRAKARHERALRHALAEGREAARLRGAQADPTASKHRRPGRGRPHWLSVVRMVIGGLLMLVSVAVAPFGIADARHDQQVARSVPVQQAVVLSVDEDKWSKSRDVMITVAGPGDGEEVEIDGADQLDRLPAVGDRIAVQVDPDDSSNVLAADADWTVHWYVYPLFVLAASCGVALCLLFFF